MSESAQADAWWLGAGDQQQLVATGWVGEHPEDGGDVAHLLLHPAGHRSAEPMRRLAQALTLTQADTAAPITTVDYDVATAHVDHDSVLHLYGRGGTELIERPVTGAWWSAAARRGYLVLSIGMDPLHRRDGDMAALDGYLERRHRYALALVGLT